MKSTKATAVAAPPHLRIERNGVTKSTSSRYEFTNLTKSLIGPARRIAVRRDGVADVEYEASDARCLLDVDLVRLVGDLVVVLMDAREEEQRGNLLAREVEVVAAEEEALLGPRVVDHCHVELAPLGRDAGGERA